MSDMEPDVPRALRDPRAHRARECLLQLARNPGASNRQLTEATGIARPAQTSRLLARLRALGLADKHRAKPGGPNAWSLTPHGTQVAHLLHNQTRTG